MNLREEIKDFIWNNYSKDTTVLDSNVDKILKLFEKRIDSIIEKLDSHDDKIKISALKQVKEMLK